MFFFSPFVILVRVADTATAVREGVKDRLISEVESIAVCKPSTVEMAVIECRFDHVLTGLWPGNVGTGVVCATPPRQSI